MGGAIAIVAEPRVCVPGLHCIHQQHLFCRHHSHLRVWRLRTFNSTTAFIDHPCFGCHLLSSTDRSKQVRAAEKAPDPVEACQETRYLTEVRRRGEFLSGTFGSASGRGCRNPHSTSSLFTRADRDGSSWSSRLPIASGVWGALADLSAAGLCGC